MSISKAISIATLEDRAIGARSYVRAGTTSRVQSEGRAQRERGELSDHAQEMQCYVDHAGNQQKQIRIQKFSRPNFLVSGNRYFLNWPTSEEARARAFGRRGEGD